MTTDPAIPVPDDKDWTWVLQRPCPECGFDASLVGGPQVGGLVRDAAQQWQIAPPRMNGAPVVMMQNIAVTFRGQ